MAIDLEEAQQLQENWLARLAFGPDRARARLVHLWSGIFPVSWRQLRSANKLQQHLQTIEEHLNADFSSLLTAMLLDPALQISLNGLANKRGRPNENLARELLELFSLGEGNYKEFDVQETARALTGYYLAPEAKLGLDPLRHDSSQKSILGKTANFNAVSLAAWLAQQPSTALHISSRLWRGLVGSLPAKKRLLSVAKQWQDQKLSLAWLHNTLINSPEAIAARGKKISDPILMISRSLALLGSRNQEALQISRVQLARMGQPPLDPPSVKGWPINEQWLNLRWLQARRQGLTTLVANEEVWNSRNLPPMLLSSLTPIPPLGLTLPSAASRTNIAQLFKDPVWQLSA